MNQEKYKDDLKDIKDMMSRSSRFISLSGLSGVSAGIVALIGAYAANKVVYSKQIVDGYRNILLTHEMVYELIGIALVTLVVALTLGIFFTTRKAKKNKQKLWDTQTQRLLINLLIPLVAGGLLCLILLFKGFIGLVAPLTLIFFGLALVNASKYTLTEIRSLGIAEIFLGLLATQFIGQGLLFWAIGFGVLNIAYGIIMQMRYGS
ncbi:MAG: hypothetical protein KDC79_14730 [Cyclobacteriaceae bacterium]|nr:hypothetical protein [Cyclobacteriaceae bacterium]